MILKISPYLYSVNKPSDTEKTAKPDSESGIVVSEYEKTNKHFFLHVYIQSCILTEAYGNSAVNVNKSHVICNLTLLLTSKTNTAELHRKMTNINIGFCL